MHSMLNHLAIFAGFKRCAFRRYNVFSTATFASRTFSCCDFWWAWHASRLRFIDSRIFKRLFLFGWYKVVSGSGVLEGGSELLMLNFECWISSALYASGKEESSLNAFWCLCRAFDGTLSYD